jgi:CRISPR system Cascade subunit CasB
MSETAPFDTGTSKDLPTRVAKIARAIFDQFGAGERAELRRLEPTGDPGSPAFWRLMAQYVPEVMDATKPWRDHDARRWATLVSAVVLLGEASEPPASLGVALAEAGMSEARLTRLLRADSDKLLHELRRVARFLATKGRAVRHLDFARLLFISNPNKAESLRRDIARGYFSTLHAQNAPS